MLLPALRPIDAAPVEVEGETHFRVCDPTGLAEEQVILSAGAFFIATLLTGFSTMRDVQAAFAKQTGGVHVPAEQILEIVRFLDGLGFLQTDTFSKKQREIIEGFRNATVREAALAGKSYSDDPATLRRFIDDFFTMPEGPGAMPATPGEDPPLRCLIVPHIDFARGACSYAHGYARLYAAGKPNTVFIFGVAHAGAPVPFVMTRKDFATPLGTLQVDHAAMDALETACDWDPYEWELVHRNEHSIEFQAVMLAYLYGPDVKIVPILAASLVADPEDKNPGKHPAVKKFLDACRAYAAQKENRVAVIAGADLAHVGPCFGDDFELDDSIRASIGFRDMEDLVHVRSGDASRWYKAVMADNNARRVCGLGCIYGALETMGKHSKSELLHYGSGDDPAGGVVTFASLAFV